MADNRNNDRLCDVAARGGTANQPVHEIVKELLAYEPEIVWREPVPRRERIADFAGLWSPSAAPPAERLSDHLGVRLDESRLFWPETDGFAWIVVHLVSVIYGSVTAQGAHWAVFWGKEWEREFGVPDWLASWLAATSPQQDDPTAWSCWVDRHDVLTVRDTRRYGLPDTSIARGCETLAVEKYYAGNELIVWRLGRKSAGAARRWERRHA